MAVSESLSVGLPVVGFDVPGIRDLVTSNHNGMLAPLGDTDALAVCILRMLGDEDLRRRLGAAGPEILERYGTDATDRIWFQKVLVS